MMEPEVDHGTETIQPRVQARGGEAGTRARRGGKRLMRAQALRACPRRRGLPKDEGDRLTAALSPSLLDRQFTAERPNQKWIADFTYVWTADGWLYVAAVIDLFSRRVVGWSMGAGMTAQLVTDALVMAIWRHFGRATSQALPEQSPLQGAFVGLCGHDAVCGG